LEVPFLSFFAKLIVLELPLFFLDYGLLKRIQAKKAVFADLVNYGIREVPCCVRDAAFKFCTNTSKSGSNSQQVM